MTASSVYIKVCGITTAEDISAVAAAGVNAIGLNLVAGPRRIGVERAGEIIAATPAGVDIWALADVSLGDSAAELGALVATRRITHVQMYGAIDRRRLEHWSDKGLRTVAVQHVSGPESFAQIEALWEEWLPAASGLLLLDAAGSQLGGTGRMLDWKLIAEMRGAGRLDGWPPLVLAGGLRPENVAEAVRVVRPFGVDVSSGVELSPGRKDREKMVAFVHNARHGDPGD